MTLYISIIYYVKEEVYRSNSLLPTRRSEEREVLKFGSISVEILPSGQDMKTIGL